jgi:hypothetical protein
VKLCICTAAFGVLHVARLIFAFKKHDRSPPKVPQWVTSDVFARPATSPVYLRLRKDSAPQRNDGEGQKQQSPLPCTTLGDARGATAAADLSWCDGADAYLGGRHSTRATRS